MESTTETIQEGTENGYARIYLDMLDKTRKELLGMYEEFGESATLRPNEFTWSAHDILSHLYLSEFGIAKMIRVFGRVATPHAAFSDEQLEQERATLSEVLSNRTEKHNAPDTIKPTDASVQTDILSSLQQSRELLLSSAQKLTDEQLRSYSFPHPIRGNLTLYGWLWFVATHELRHTEQMRELH
jgi:uncharacterized damage-inducible protein DinB